MLELLLAIVIILAVSYLVSLVLGQVVAIFTFVVLLLLVLLTAPGVHV